jgi:TonB family protein
VAGAVGTAFDAPVWHAPVATIERVGAATVSLDVALVGVWLATSLGLLAWLTLAVIRLWRERATWQPVTVDGRDVLVSRDVGPAVVDPIKGTIVVPRWLYDAPPTERRLALHHEIEHVTASDHRLAWGAVLLTVFFPWNPVLWWQSRRLRAAIELDCDRRVLAAGIPTTAYAELLFRTLVAGRPPRLQPALIEHPSMVRRRIQTMMQNRVRYPRVRSVIYGATAVALVFVACDTPAPVVPGDQEVTAVAPALVGPADGQVYPESYTGIVVPERVSCPPVEYPELLRQAGIEGAVFLRFVVERDGTVSPATAEVLSSDYRGFERPVQRMIAGCRFRPGEFEGEPVRVLVTMDVRFALARSGSPRPSGSGTSELPPIDITARGPRIP